MGHWNFSIFIIAYSNSSNSIFSSFDIYFFPLKNLCSFCSKSRHFVNNQTKQTKQHLQQTCIKSFKTKMKPPSNGPTVNSFVHGYYNVHHQEQLRSNRPLRISALTTSITDAPSDPFHVEIFILFKPEERCDGFFKWAKQHHTCCFTCVVELNLIQQLCID